VPVSWRQLASSKVSPVVPWHRRHARHCCPAPLAEVLSWVPWALVPHASGQSLHPDPQYRALLRLPSSFPVGSLSFPSGTLGWRIAFGVPPGLHQVRLGYQLRQPIVARMSFWPVILFPAVAPKETGGSPEFPGYPSKHMPRSQTPVVSRPLAFAQTRLLPSKRCTLSALGPLTRTYPLTTIIHFSEFNDAACALAFPLLRTPPLSDPPSVRLSTCWLGLGRAGFSPAG